MYFKKFFVFLNNLIFLIKIFFHFPGGGGTCPFCPPCGRLWIWGPLNSSTCVKIHNACFFSRCAYIVLGMRHYRVSWWGLQFYAESEQSERLYRIGQNSVIYLPRGNNRIKTNVWSRIFDSLEQRTYLHYDLIISIHLHIYYSVDNNILYFLPAIHHNNI